MEEEIVANGQPPSSRSPSCLSSSHSPSFVVLPPFLINIFASDHYKYQRDIFHQYSALITPWLFVATISAVAALRTARTPLPLRAAHQGGAQSRAERGNRRVPRGHADIEWLSVRVHGSRTKSPVGREWRPDFPSGRKSRRLGGSPDRDDPEGCAP